MLNTPLSPWPSFTQEEADAVSKVLLSNKVNYWTGEECRLFEREFASWCGVDYAVSVANGTVALDLALKGLGIGHGDEVIVTPKTFLASVSCVISAGATPVFADIDLNSQALTSATIASCISPKTKAVIVVHLGGMPAEMDSIMALAEHSGIYVIEDCAQAHGAVYKGRSVGSIGHVGAWSFCQDKILTTGGEGGMVTTNNKILWEKMWSYKDHGKSWDAVYALEHPPGFRWVHESFGTNWRMMEMQAAIGRIQLRKIKSWSAARRYNASMIEESLKPFDFFRFQEIPPYILHAQYKYYAFLKLERLPGDWTRQRVISQLNELGVPCYEGSCSEVYLEKCFDNTSFRPTERLPIAKQLGESSMMFLVHPSLTKNEIAEMCAKIYNFFSGLNCDQI